MSSQAPTPPDMLSGANLQNHDWDTDEILADQAVWPDLQLPQDIAAKPGAKVHEIISEIQIDFAHFWEDRMQYAVAQGGMYVADKNNMTKDELALYEKMDTQQRRHIVDETDRQESYQRDIYWADLMLTNTFALAKEFPDADIVIDLDIDDVIGRQEGEGKDMWFADLPEMEGVDYRNPAPEHEDLVNQIALREQASRMVFRAALGPVTRKINHDLNNAQHPNKVRFGLSSSHVEAEMRGYLAPRLHGICQGFDVEEMMSSKDSPIAERVKVDMQVRLAALQQAASAANMPFPTQLSYVDMIKVYPELDGLFDLTDEATLKELDNGDLGPQGIKPFMAARRVRELAERGFKRTIIVQVDDWALFEPAVNAGDHVRFWHLDQNERFVLPGERGYTNKDDIANLLAELGLEAKHE
ncbi:MAG TPA: hypothetical protein VLG47_06715 [Candidatus Saccharimonadales bacterium]|nr:hypothetical protein [Candidatus Saccharimonadales bacterium]